MTFDPRLLRSHVWNKDHYVQIPWKYVKVRGYSDHFFFKNVNKKNKTKKCEPKVIDP